jgi:hypothetical protein
VTNPKSLDFASPSGGRYPNGTYITQIEPRALAATTVFANEKVTQLLAPAAQQNALSNLKVVNIKLQLLKAIEDNRFTLVHGLPISSGNIALSETSRCNSSSTCAMSSAFTAETSFDSGKSFAKS